MPWKLKKDYSSPDLEAIKVSMRNFMGPKPNGTYLAMYRVVFEEKRPIHSKYPGVGVTETDAPLTPGHARTAFDKAWVHDYWIDEIEEIALKDGLEWRANG